MTTPGDQETAVAEMGEVITATRLALCRLDRDTSAGEFRFTEGVIWALCDLVAVGFANAYAARSLLPDEQREECARTPAGIVGDWRDSIRVELEGLLQEATLAAHDLDEQA